MIDPTTPAEIVNNLRAEGIFSFANPATLIAANLIEEQQKVMTDALMENIRLKNVIDELNEYNAECNCELAKAHRKIANIEDKLQDAVNQNESLVNSIITACTGSGCLNAHELRVKLDEVTGWQTRAVKLLREFERGDYIHSYDDGDGYTDETCEPPSEFYSLIKEAGVDEDET